MRSNLIPLFICTSLGLVVLFHLYWAGGGRRGADLVIPRRRDDGARLFEPTPLATLCAAAFLAGMALLAAAEWLDRPVTISAQVIDGLQILAGVIFVARAIGDFRHIGFSKSVRGTAFAWWDDRLFSPLVLLIGMAFFLIAFR